MENSEAPLIQVPDIGQKQFLLHVDVECECGCLMYQDRGRGVMWCQSQFCRDNGKQYHLPKLTVTALRKFGDVRDIAQQALLRRT